MGASSVQSWSVLAKGGGPVQAIQVKNPWVQLHAHTYTRTAGM